jgi:cyclase
MKHFKIIFIVTLLLLPPGLLSQQKPVYQITKLTDGIYELSNEDNGYPVKVIVSAGKDGILIVDSGEKELGDALVDAIKSFNKGMPKIIINTHSHIEHLGGNIATGKSPVIIGHKNLRDRYTNGLYVFNMLPDSVLPNVTFTDSLTIFFNGEDIKLLSFTGAHDNSDIIVWFTKSKIVCTAALCGNRHFPSIDGELGNILNYPDVVFKIISILPEDVLIVPGHSADCTMKEYREFYDMLIKTSNVIRTELAKGKNTGELQKEDILADWKQWESYVDRNVWIKFWVDAIKNPKTPGTKKKVYAPIYYKILESGGDSAIALYNNLKSMHSDEYEFEERTAMWIGRRLANTGMNDDAIKFLNLCITENPGSEAAYISHYSLGNIYWNSGSKNPAKEHYVKYLERFPEDETVLQRIKE